MHRDTPLVVQRPEGLYCPQGDFHIDPWRAVPRAVITHAHADHARRGHGAYLCSREGEHVLRARLGRVSLQTLDWGEAIDLGGVRISLHPAGHVLGSAQVRLQHRGKVWVASGDYFLSGAGDANPSCTAFEPVRCDCFITENTFGLPLYRWRAQTQVLADVLDWWRANAEQGLATVLMGYSFGKAQRLLAGLGPGLEAGLGPIAVHESIASMNLAYEASGVRLPPCIRLEALTREQARRALVVTPPGSLEGPGMRHLAGLTRWRTAFCSGWMQLRRARQRPGMDRGFVMSDHADWPGLQAAITATGAPRVIVTHGEGQVLIRWLRERGLEAGSFRTAFGDEEREREGEAGIEADADVPALSAPVER